MIGLAGRRRFNTGDSFLFCLRNYRIKYARSWVRKWRARMKFASLENALIAATLVTFAVFVVWSFKIIVGWA